jgi:hypothetical protein
MGVIFFGRKSVGKESISGAYHANDINKTDEVTDNKTMIHYIEYCNKKH